jgi:hypothetical protein
MCTWGYSYSITVVVESYKTSVDGPPKKQSSKPTIITKLLLQLDPIWGCEEMRGVPYQHFGMPLSTECERLLFFWYQELTIGVLSVFNFPNSKFKQLKIIPE